jgi:nonribosomal peptide synthetase CepB
MHDLQQRGGLKAMTATFAQWIVLRVPADLNLERITRAVQAVVDHHGALRARLVPDDTGAAAHLEIPPPGTLARTVRRVRVPGLADSPLDNRVRDDARQTSADLDPTTGDMIRFVWFDRGAEDAGRLLVVAHHLVVDGVSWRILAADLAAAWEALAAGRPPQLEPVATSFHRYTTLLAEDAHAPARTAELEDWTLLLHAANRGPGRPSAPERYTEADMEQLSFTVPPDLTEALTTTVPAAFHAGVNDVLLAGAAAALAEWRDSPVLVDIETHGRHDFTGELDLSRTVGWFTALYPVRLDPELADPADVRNGGPGVGSLVKQVKELTRAVPQAGLGYGQLRYLNAETQTIMADLPRASIGFNYLGRFTLGEKDSTDWRLAGPDAMGSESAQDLPAAHLLELGALVRANEAGQAELLLMLSWVREEFANDDVPAFADGWLAALRGIALHAAEPGTGGHTPSDLSLVELTQRQIDELEYEFDDVEEETSGG